MGRVKLNALDLDSGNTSGGKPDTRLKAIAAGVLQPVAISAAGVETAGSIRNSGAAICTVQHDAATDVTLNTISGMSVNLVSGRYYAIEAVLFGTSTANGGVKLGTGGTATATATRIQTDIYADGTMADATSDQVTALGTLIGVTAIAMTRIVVQGYIRVNAGGTFTFTFAQNASHADTSSIYVGSWMRLTDITP